MSNDNVSNALDRSIHNAVGVLPDSNSLLIVSTRFISAYYVEWLVQKPYCCSANKLLLLRYSYN